MGPNAIYSQGLGRFITILIGDTPEKRLIATTFGAMALSTFIFDTLDSATRLGRYVLQELFGSDGKVAAVIATLATCLVPLGFLAFGTSGRFRLFWTLFGTSNQLLASLTLLAISVWLYRGGGRRAAGKVPWFTVVPMALVLAVTVTSLVLQARSLFTKAAGSTAWVNGLVSVILLALAATLIGYGAQVLRRRALEGAP
jgi:carbon starvation protein